MALRQDEFTSLCDDVDLDRDRALVERCQAGDSNAFGNLYARYYERLLRFCLRRLNDRHEAEDAAQEAFARAWKALPNFAGERRFYPWLTVIAGNICTDMLRRRSRSTPTDDLELGTHQPVGVSNMETNDERIIAAVDGELVNKALDRLSVRHRHVLAMREGSGWTYQQIADHEGVEIGTIETLLWRARQALKREFTVLSESKGALGGFLAGTGALLRRGFLRAAHRSAVVQQGTGGGGSFRNAFAGVAVTSAAVAAAIITPVALHTSNPPAAPSAISAGSQLAAPQLPIPDATAPTPVPVDDSSTGAPIADAAGAGDSSITGSSVTASGTPSKALQSTVKNAPAGSSGGHPGLVDGPVAPELSPVVSTVGSAATGLTNTIDNLGTTLGLTQILSTLGLVAPSATTTTTTSTGLLPTITNTVNSTLKNLLGKH